MTVKLRIFAYLEFRVTEKYVSIPHYALEQDNTTVPDLEFGQFHLCTSALRLHRRKVPGLCTSKHVSWYKAQLGYS